MSDRNRYFAWPAYSVAFLLTLVPAFDATMSVWPLQVMVERWRFGAVGLLSNALMLPTLGLFIALVTALFLEHRRVLRIMGGACAAFAAIVLAVLVVFTLDALQTRANVNKDLLLSYDIATITAVMKQILFIVSMASFSIAGFRSLPSAAVRGRSRSRGRTASPLFADGSVQG